MVNINIQLYRKTKYDLCVIIWDSLLEFIQPLPITTEHKSLNPIIGYLTACGKKS